MPAAATLEARPSSFIGRDPQLQQLETLLASVLNGAGRVCFVGGEPGVGKTALVQEFTRRAQENHPELIVAIGDCSATSATSDAYLPFREILGLLTGDTDASLAEGAITVENASRLRTLVERAGDVVAEYGVDLIDVFVPGTKLVTRVGSKLARKFGVGALQPSTSSPTTTLDDPARVLQQFTNVVRKLAEVRPIVLVIDDAHWADPASIDLLFHLARRIEGSRILLLATYRANEVSAPVNGERHPLQQVLNEVARYYGDATIALDTDDTSAGRAFVDRLLDAEANQLPATFREDLFRHTLGHPLFTLELLNALRERGTIRRDADGGWRLAGDADWHLLPKRTEGVIAERIGRIPTELRDVLAIAAVEGEQFSAQVVARVAGKDASDVIRQLGSGAEREHQLVRALGVQKIGGQRIAGYRFRHELFRAYLYDSLDEVQRSEFHFAVGRELEQMHTDAPDDITPVLAHHFERAGEMETAVDYLNRAADSALRRSAPKQAAEFWRRVLALLPDSAAAANERIGIMEKRADALRLAGAFDDARAVFEQGIAAAVDPLTRARLLRKLGAACTDQHHLDEAIAHLARAQTELSSARDNDEVAAERVQLLLDRVWALYWTNDPGMAEFLASGIDIIDRIGTIADRARFHQMRLLARLRIERYRPSDESLQLASHQLETARLAGHAPTYAHCAFLHGFTHLWRGHLDTAEDSLRETLRIAEQHAHGLIIVLAKTYLTVMFRLRGHADEVLSHAQAARAAALETGMATYVVAALANRAWAHYRRGELDLVEPLTREALEAWNTTVVTYPFKWLGVWPLAAVLFERGEKAATLDVVKVVLQPGQQIPPPGIAAAIEQGDIERALACARAAGEL